MTSQVQEIKLITLGHARLEADGHPIKLVMRRGLEVMTYLLMNPDCTRGQIENALWPDDSPDAGWNYFYQVRHEINRVVPGVSLQFDKNSKTYSIVVDGPTLRWDYAELWDALMEENPIALDLYTGPFLTQSESEWARSEREKLEWSVVKLSLKLMDQWSARGEHQRREEVARRMLEIEPWNDVLVEYLISSVLENHGLEAARTEFSKIEWRFLEEVGGLPPKFIELGKRLQPD